MNINLYRFGRTRALAAMLLPAVLLAAAGLWSKTAGAIPAACTPGNIIVDGSFETTNPNTMVNPSWATTSTQFGTSLCSFAYCGNESSEAAPRTGTFWSWFGSVTGIDPEVATMSQSVTFPIAPATATLNFGLWIGFVTTPFTDVLDVKVDGLTRQTFTEPATVEPGYTLRSINLSAFVDGAAHTILFSYVKGTDGQKANFSVDDVSLDVVCNDIIFANDYESAM